MTRTTSISHVAAAFSKSHAMSTPTAMSSSTALAKRQNEDMALMPPPPKKITKRPATVLDEDEYTNALSNIIARDYFPGLAEAKAQEEYLSALESNDSIWIRDAGQKLKEAMTPVQSSKIRRTARDTRFDTSRSWHDKTPVADTPRGNYSAGNETPMTVASSEAPDEANHNSKVDTSNLSLTSFQSKYTSEDNESFNTVLDKQNNTRRKKHAYLWAPDQRIPSSRLLTHRAQQSHIQEAKLDHEALAAKHNETALVPLTTGATASRPASVQSWQQKTPNNSLMFFPDGIEESGLQTVMSTKEAASHAGPKETVFANTRFPPQHFLEDDEPSDSGPPSPSLDTQIIATRDARRANKPCSIASTSTFGGETPRVNGYAFVDEDEPENISPPIPNEPTYRDLLAGQTGDSTPNPFKISEIRHREDLHLRLVAKEQAKKREKESMTVKGSGVSGTGNMTPAARKLMEKLGRTPVHQGVREQRMSSTEMWTPGAQTRRKK